MFKLRTFIVEDSPVILQNLVETLEELADVDVIGTAATEGASIQGWREQDGAVDLVIIDIFLKAGSGLGVLKQAVDLGLRGKRVVLTNYATPDVRLRCAELGADRVFDKSSELEALIDYCECLANKAGADPRAS